MLPNGTPDPNAQPDPNAPKPPAPPVKPPEAPAPKPPEPKKDPTAGEQKPEGEGKTLTQDEVNKLVGATRKDARETAQKDTLKELGFADLESARAALKDYEEAKRSKMSADERAAADLKAAQEAKAQAEATAKTAVAQAQEARLEAEIVAQAAGRFANPKAVLKLLDRAAVKFGEDGKVEGVKEALDALAKAEPWTLAQKGAGPRVPGIGATNTGEGPQARTDEDRRKQFFGGGAPGGFFEKQPEVVTEKKTEG